MCCKLACVAVKLGSISNDSCCNKIVTLRYDYAEIRIYYLLYFRCFKLTVWTIMWLHLTRIYRPKNGNLFFPILATFRGVIGFLVSEP